MSSVQRRRMCRRGGVANGSGDGIGHVCAWFAQELVGIFFSFFSSSGTSMGGDTRLFAQGR